MGYVYNKNAFATIETEEDAYWLGFILADGYVSGPDKPAYLQIKLGIKDYAHLQKWRKYLGYTTDDIIKFCYGGAYTKDNECAVVKTSCKTIAENLRKYNLSGPKSGKEKPYILHNLQLETAYIRGIFDGDGWIRTTQNGLGVCGSYETVQYIQNFINTNILDISNNHISQHGIIYKLEVNGKKQVKQILDFFYKNATIYLDRKYNIYLDKYCRV